MQQKEGQEVARVITALCLKMQPNTEEEEEGLDHGSSGRLSLSCALLAPLG